ncbi:unnamed protein product [Ostreobium quekettii]|uniref:Uncharacterized protein n=1 Tax=Ostreobium quekettii TaxID=121088 RepID=A0A8S1J4K7_9CHLO|nr:unnamed protein product [Ostreobium quekettii]
MEETCRCSNREDVLPHCHAALLRLMSSVPKWKALRSAVRDVTGSVPRRMASAYGCRMLAAVLEGLGSLQELVESALGSVGHGLNGCATPTMRLDAVKMWMEAFDMYFNLSAQLLVPSTRLNLDTCHYHPQYRLWLRFVLIPLAKREHMKAGGDRVPVFLFKYVHSVPS